MCAPSAPGSGRGARLPSPGAPPPRPAGGPGGGGAPRGWGDPLPAAVLFDRDGTLIADVPDNADPARVEVLPGVAPGLERLRAARIPTAVVTNQSGGAP